MPTSDTVYTFSFTTDWFQTVNAVAPMSDATVAPTTRSHRVESHDRNTLSVMRNQRAAETALDTAASTLMRAAIFPATGSSEKTCPTMTNSGLPGGCGNPKE